jgi:hypothetical protein
MSAESLMRILEFDPNRFPFRDSVSRALGAPDLSRQHELIPSDLNFLYQRIPTFRVQLPDNEAVGEFHRDSDYNPPKRIPIS